MPEPKVLLDENVCYANGRFDRDTCEGLVLELKALGIDAVYVDQAVPGSQRFCRSNPDFYSWFNKIYDLCTQVYIRDRNAGVKPATLNQTIKNCVKRSLAEEPKGPCTLYGGVPPRGTDDRDIREYAERTGRVIISCDRGPELESTSVSDRIALPISSHPPTAQQIQARLQGLGL